MRRSPPTSFVVALVLGLVAIAFPPDTQAGDDKTPIKVGVYASLTGSEATWGQSYERGVRLAVASINSSGGVLGRPIAILIEDNRSKSGESATAVRKLISRDKVVGILGEVSSGRSLEAATVCQQMRVPMISSGTNPKVTEVGNFIFRGGYIDPFQGTVMARFAREHLLTNRVALLTDSTNAYAVGLAKYFKERFLADGGVVAIEQHYNASERDFKAQLTAIKGSGVDVLFVPGYYTEVGLIVSQARDLGIEAPILGGDGWSSPQLLFQAGKSLRNTYFCDCFSIETDIPSAQRFIASYRERYHEDPDSIAPQAFDAMCLLADAITRADSLNANKIRAALAETKAFAGVSGSVTIDAQRNPQLPAFVVGFNQGRYQLVKTVVP